MRTHRTRTRHVVVPMIASLALLAAACGSDDDDVADDATPAATAAPATDAPATDAPATDDTTADTTAETTGGGTTDTTAAPEPEPEPEPAAGEAGGFATVLIHNDGISTMDPKTSLVHSTVNSMPLAAIYDLLVYIDPETGLVEPYLAESLESNEDGSVWTMTLNSGIEFSDGTPFNAEAVHAEMQRIAQPDSAAAMRAAAEVVTTEVVDDLVIEFRPNQPDLNYGHVIALNFPMIPSPTAIAAGEDFARSPVGAGPFMLDNWVVGETKTFVRNPNYWQEGLPLLDGFETVVVSDEQQQINRMQAGDAQLISNQQASLFQAGRDAGFEVVTGPKLSGGFIFVFNHERAPFDDVRVRRAFQLAVDTKALNETLFPLGGTEAPVNHFSTDSPFYNPEHDFSAPDLEEAQRLINEVAAEQGGTLTFDIVTRNGGPLAVAEFAQQQFLSLDNVEVTITALDGGDYLTAVRGGEYQTAYYTGWWSAPYPVMHQIYKTGEPLNYSNYSNPEVDALFDAARDTQDFDEQYAAYDEIARIMKEDVVVLPYLVSEVGFMHPGVIGGLTGVHLGNTPLWAHVYLTE